MPNLVGIGNSQVPTNAMLGGLAYQDSVGEINIDKIKAKTGDTATDIFVYDTRKDSDGGAWRHRTQNTSWYNETPSEYRGHRKEFPAVAVIVSVNNKVVIYDGDDPNFSMWMVFLSGPSGSSERLLRYSTNYSGRMLNGVLCVATGDTLAYISFIDEYHMLYHTGSNYYFPHKTGIVDRNKIYSEPRYIAGTFGIASSGARHVSMTVLPNAPIHVATGLPLPTIAVATVNGTSVILDNRKTNHVPMNAGESYDTFGTTSGYVESRKVQFSGEYLHIIHDPSLIYTYKISEFIENNSGGTLVGYVGLSFFTTWANGTGSASNAKLAAKDDSTILIGDANTGLALLYPDYTYTANSLDPDSRKMICRITKDFNTGWMLGDIEGAFMSDTDTTNVTGSELLSIPGPSFSNTNNWYLDASNQTSGTIATLTVSSGRLVFTHSDTNAHWDGFGASFSCTVGEVYVVSADIHSATNMNVLRISNTASQHDEDIVVAGSNAAGIHAHTFTATATTMYLHWNGYTNTSAMQLNSVSVRIGEEDRSVNNNGLQVFGTITKSPVASGAELVAYSGFSATNYLQQPINSDLQFGTGDWAFYGWYYDGTSGSGARTIFEIGRSTVAGDHIGLRHDGNNLELFISDDSFASQDVAEVGLAARDGWHFACALRRGKNIELWYDGIRRATTLIDGAAGDLGDSETYLRFGNRTYTSQPWDGSLALWRVSKTAPSREQIRKMYEEENALFQPNAKCTIYGTSDGVTGLAVDDSNDMIHVGTSSGRSEFQHLSRINNTTTAVTTEISASNGLVAEQ